MSDEIEPFPQPKLRDRVRVGMDAGLAAIPYAGGSLQVLVEAVIVPSITKRRESWFVALGEIVAKLQQGGFDIARLADDEAFVTALGDASRIAMGTHLAEKLDLLKNCLLHMAVDDNRDDFLDLRLFGFVDELAPEHFVVLDYLNDPLGWFEKKVIPVPNISHGSPMSALQEARLPIEGMALGIVLRELDGGGLAQSSSLTGIMSRDGVFAARTTDLGRELLDFVREV